MKKRSVLLLVLGVICYGAYGQSPYSLSNVPEAVKNKAAVVTHLQNTELEVESIDKASLSVHKIFTVLNEDGAYALFFNEYSSKFISLEDVDIKVYDATGKQTEKFRKKDLTTVAVGEGLIDDGYVTYYAIKTRTYPVTVDLKYEQKLKSTLFLPDYRFIRPGEGVVLSNYTAKIPTDISLRYKAVNTSMEPVITGDEKYKIYKWSVNNLPPVKDEEGSVSARSKYPYINLVANKFSHFGFDGDFSSWKNFGDWLNKLYTGLDVLPTQRQEFFSNLVKDTPGDKEKVKKIYEYLQDNFRYVSIQLGIGGWKPFPAEFTDQKKYGDCKGLSNYMKAALKSVGIKSHIAIINSEYNGLPVDPDFPENDFNHAILCVPGQKDSIWLECTSSTAEFGVLGTSTENRNALLITENGGVLVSTPKSHSSFNTISSRTTLAISDDLSGQAETGFSTKGAFSELFNSILKEKKDHQKEILVSYLGCKQPDDFEFSKSEAKGAQKIKLLLAIRKVPEFISGHKLFINPRMYKMWSAKLPSAENRKLDFYFRFPFERTDTTVMKLAAGMKPDALPTEKALTSDYANYTSKYWYNETENSIYSVTTLILKKHKVVAADYPALKTFFDNVAQEDAQKIVIRKSDTTPASEPQKKTF